MKTDRGYRFGSSERERGIGRGKGREGEGQVAMNGTNAGREGGVVCVTWLAWSEQLEARYKYCF